ncbi:MAG TPA: hypothetical protein VEB18_01655 [Candidatus Paceibacterota bacterium]|nr:hypothetical protein [Candidatus Paceibacterota bacterium]
MKQLLIIAAALALGWFTPEARAQEYLHLDTPPLAQEEKELPLELSYTQDRQQSFGIFSPLVENDVESDRLVLVSPEVRFAEGITGSFYEIRVSCPVSRQDYPAGCPPAYESVKAYGVVLRIRLPFR